MQFISNFSMIIQMYIFTLLTKAHKPYFLLCFSPASLYSFCSLFGCYPGDYFHLKQSDTEIGKANFLNLNILKIVACPHPHETYSNIINFFSIYSWI